jgi:hypothetical protein
MPKTFRPWHLEQTTLLPPSPSDWLSMDHQVYILLDLVDELDLSQVLISAQAKDPRGEKGFDPRMPASPGELPPVAPHRSVRDTLASYGSCHPAATPTPLQYTKRSRRC